MWPLTCSRDIHRKKNLFIKTMILPQNSLTASNLCGSNEKSKNKAIRADTIDPFRISSMGSYYASFHPPPYPILEDDERCS